MTDVDAAAERPEVESIPLAEGEGKAPFPPAEVDDAAEVEAATRAIKGGKGLPTCGVRRLGDDTGRVAVYSRKTKTGELVGVLSAPQYVAALEAAAGVGVLEGDSLNAQGMVRQLVRDLVDEKRIDIERRKARAQARLDAIEAELADLD